MAIGNLHTEGDLRRFIEAELRRPGATPPTQPPISKFKNGIPSDADFPHAPGDGILALDTSTMTLYARVSGEWKAV